MQLSPSKGLKDFFSVSVVVEDSAQFLQRYDSMPAETSCGDTRGELFGENSTVAIDNKFGTSGNNLAVRCQASKWSEINANMYGGELT